MVLQFSPKQKRFRIFFFNTLSFFGLPKITFLTLKIFFFSFISWNWRIHRNFLVWRGPLLMSGLKGPSGYANKGWGLRASTLGFYYITATHENHRYKNFKKKKEKKWKKVQVSIKWLWSTKKWKSLTKKFTSFLFRRSFCTILMVVVGGGV